jgi:UPF0755 protein
VLLSLAIFITLVGIVGYRAVFTRNVVSSEPVEFFIKSGSDYEVVREALNEMAILKKSWTFDLTSRLMKYDVGRIRPGRYIISPSMSNHALVTMLRAGIQSPVKITFNSARTIEDLAGQIATYIELDSTSLSTYFTDTAVIGPLGYDSNTVLCIFIPNTYEVYWTASEEEIFNRMKKESDQFWNANQRLSKLEKWGLSAVECITLASIVEKESILNEERPRIAGVYLNRLERNIPLQADPTVVFAVKDFTIRRVLNKHLATDSPYNTYRYQGLPPGPICMPSIASLDAVLNAEEHDFIFFCAKPGYNGAHAFARTNREHEKNARIYRRWLDKQGIRG